MRKTVFLTLVGLCLCVLLSACVPRVEDYLPVPSHSFWSVHFVGTSMSPTIGDNQWGIEESYASGETPARGDIVTFVAPPEPQKHYCKRIIGQPGDIISVEGTTIRLNGITLYEPYVVFQGNPSPHPLLLAIVPPNDYFVLGDNRAVSYDSRWWQFLPRSSIVGRIIALDDSANQAQPVQDESGVFALAAKQHLTGAFFTGWSGYYLTGNAALLLFLPTSSFPVFFVSVTRKRPQKKVALFRHPTAYPKHQSNAWYRLGGLLPTIVVLLLLGSSFLTACGSAKQNPTPTPTITNSAYRPLIAVDVEIDTPPLYQLGHEVAVAVANKIDDMATRINSGGMVIFVCRISSYSWDDCPVSFKTPSIQAWVLPPSPPVCGNDPYACSTLKQKYQKDLKAWYAVHASQVRALEQARAFVHTLTAKIKNMVFPWDNRGSDIWNALATGAQNLQGINAPYKYLLLATDFISTTQQQGSFSLSGVRVVSIFRTASDNAFYQQSNSYWSHVVRSAGAVSFTSYSVAQSQALGLELPA